MKQLVDRARNGDLEAERQLFEYLRVRFQVIAKRRVCEPADAEDIAQDACLTVAEKYKGQQFSVGFEAWAYGVLKMKIGNYLQKHKVRHREVVMACVGSTAGTAKETSDPYLRRRLIECLRQLIAINRNYARALNLVYQGYAAREACSRMNVTPNNFYVILNRGRSMYRACLEGGRT